MIIPENLLLDVADGNLPLDDVLETYGGSALDTETRTELMMQRAVHRVLHESRVAPNHTEMIEGVRSSVMNALSANVPTTATATASSGIVGTVVTLIAVATTSAWIAFGPPVASMMSSTSSTVSSTSNSHTHQAAASRMSPATPERNDAPADMLQPVVSTSRSSTIPSTNGNEVRHQVPSISKERIDATTIEHSATQLDDGKLSVHVNDNQLSAIKRIEDLKKTLAGSPNTLSSYRISRDLYQAYMATGDIANARGTLQHALAYAKQLGNDAYILKCENDLRHLSSR